MANWYEKNQREIVNIFNALTVQFERLARLRESVPESPRTCTPPAAGRPSGEPAPPSECGQSAPPSPVGSTDTFPSEAPGTSYPSNGVHLRREGKPLSDSEQVAFSLHIALVDTFAMLLLYHAQRLSLPPAEPNEAISDWIERVFRPVFGRFLDDQNDDDWQP